MTTLFVCDGGAFREAKSEEVLECAEATLARRFRIGSPVLSRPDDVRAFLRFHLAHLPYEVFGCLYLDCRHRLIAREDLFRGTIDGTVVYPREIIRGCIRHEAAELLIYHNHPSGEAAPSKADVFMTGRVREAMEFIGVRLLDHWIVGQSVISMAELGLV
jgi:DNA repair protein RadC